MTRPSLLFWSQHSLGLGHLVRSLALADALTAHFHVVLLNGGRMPAGMRVPDGVEVVNLVPLGHDDGYELVSHDPDVDVDTAKQRRVATILDALDRHRPAVVLLELYPFGRKKFAFEIEPLLAAVAALGAARPRVVCSVRDILVNQRRDQARHDERASVAANAHLDAILVHSDPAFARLDDSFRPATPLAVPVHHTGFVAPRPAVAVPTGAIEQVDRVERVVVSVGGGMVGEPIVRAAVAAHRRVADTTGLSTTVIGGPFLPEPVWQWLVDQAATSPDLEAIRQVPDLAGEIARSAVSVSQCGYNTTMDLLRAGTPAVVVPYREGKEDEQTRRAVRLRELGLLEVVDPDVLDAVTLADAIVTAHRSSPPTTTLDLDGADRSARIIAELALGPLTDAPVPTATTQHLGAPA